MRWSECSATHAHGTPTNRFSRDLSVMRSSPAHLVARTWHTGVWETLIKLITCEQDPLGLQSRSEPLSAPLPEYTYSGGGGGGGEVPITLELDDSPVTELPPGTTRRRCLPCCTLL